MLQHIRRLVGTVQQRFPMFFLALSSPAASFAATAKRYIAPTCMRYLLTLLVTALLFLCTMPVGDVLGQDTPGSTPDRAERAFVEAHALYTTHLYREAIQAFSRFRGDRPDHLHAIDALYYEAEAQLALGFHDEAIALFERLETEYPRHPLASKSRLALGNFFYLSERYDQALVVFSNLLEDDPKPGIAAKTLYRMGASARYLGRNEEALEYFEQAANEYRETEYAPVALYASGYTRIGMGRYDEAAEALELLAARYPESPHVRNIGLALAEVYYELGDYDRVLSEIERRVGGLDEAGRERALFLQAESLNQLRDSEQAIVHYRRFLDRYPGSAYQRRAVYGLGWNYYFEGVHQWAAERFAEVRSGHDDDLTARATYYEAINQDLALEPLAAIALLENFLSQWPGHELAPHAHFELAVLYYRQHRWDDAYRVFGVLQETWPTHDLAGEAAYYRANTAIALGNFEDAFSHFDRAVNAGAASERLREEVRFQRAWLSYRRASYREAMHGFLEIHDLSPRSERGQEALFWAAESIYQLDNMSRAEELFTRYIQDVPEGKHVTAAWYALGWTHFRRSQYEEAVEAFQTFLDRHRTSDEDGFVSYQTDALLRLADSYYVLKQYPNAIRTYRLVGNQGGDYALYQIAQAFDNAGEAYEAVSAFRELLEFHPGSQWAQEARYSLGHLFFRNQDYDQAIEEYNALLRTWPRDPLAAKAQYGIGDAFFNAGRAEEAVTAYRIVLEEYPGSTYVSDAAAGIQIALLSTGDTEAAAAFLEEFAEQNPESPVIDELRFRLAEINLQSGQTDEALAGLLDFIQQGRSEYLRSEAHYYLGTIFEERDQDEDAILHFVQVIEEYAGSERFPDASRRLGGIYLQSERPLEALDVFRYLESDSDGDQRLVAEARYGQGMALLQLDRSEEAEQLLQDAIDAAPDAVETYPAYLGLARVHQEAGRYGDAEPLYRHVARNSRDETGAEALYRLGALFRETGRAEQALEELGRLPVLFLGFNEWVARGYLEQARTFQGLGEIGEAASLYDLVISEFGETPHAAVAEQEKAML